MSSATEEIRRALLGKYPLVYLLTWEEERTQKLLESFAAKLYRGQGAVTTWSCVQGFAGGLEDPGLTDPARAIQTVIAHGERGFFLFKDLHVFMDQPPVTRSLRDAYHALGRGDKFIFFLSPQLAIPDSLIKEVFLVEMRPPDEKELGQLVARQAQAYGVELERELVSQLPVALKGLTLNEAQHSLHRILRSRRGSVAETLKEVFVEKANIVRKTGLLEAVMPDAALGDIGGLDNLKEWLLRRRRLFSREAIADGVPTPKGMLVMGVSGCGKSFAAKAVSELWNVPLFRLDMSLVFSGGFGSPEEAFHRALATIESLAPAILWIDEIENSLGMEEGRTDMSSQVFSAFLTWMQEKPPLIFVAATANRIEALPAEIIRKGRFDQVYFVDLPNDEERRHILEIHLRRNGVDAEHFDFDLLIVSTKGWNGAELEQAVIAARVDAYSEGRSLGMDDLTANTASMVPLSTTMAEQIKSIRAWAVRRATPASKYGTRPRI